MKKPTNTLLFLILRCSMIVKTTQSLQVAILGSGMTGATVARTLADQGVQVTVFEAGRGIGGRTSTRIVNTEDLYQFDHGAQYISKPKTDIFQRALNQWKEDSWVKEWSGNFGTVTITADTKLQLEEDPKKERWVGYPTMHTLCQNILNHPNIRVQLQTLAHARESKTESKKWEVFIRNNEEEEEKGTSLGSFDWLVATDRNSAADFRTDLSLANVEGFRMGVRNVASVKSLAAMVVFEKPLMGLNLDGIQFSYPKKGVFGSLGWVARDTSKPGRQRDDEKECWVLQSHPEAAEEILKGMTSIEDIREKAKDVLINDFAKCLPLLASSNHKSMDQLPPIVYAVGHRWGAAFPIPTQEYKDMNSQLFEDQQFIACGDYFGTSSGRIEGAYLSGLSAANQLLNQEKLILSK